MKIVYCFKCKFPLDECVCDEGEGMPLAAMELPDNAGDLNDDRQFA